MKHIWTALALLTIACATRPIVTPVVPRSAPLMLGANDAFHGPEPPDIVAEWCTWRSPWIRTPHLSADSLHAFMASAAACPSIHTLALVEGPDAALAGQLGMVAGVEALEVGNELELAPHNLTTNQYAQAVAQMHDAARSVGFSGEIIAGAVYAITDDTKQRIGAAMASCPDCSVGLHIYEVPSADDLNWIRALGRRVWITETGYPTRCDPARLQGQADFLRAMLAALGTVENIVGVLIYQRPAGSACTDLDTFSIQGTPAEEILR